MARPASDRLRAALDDQLAELDATAYDGPDARLPDALIAAVLAAYDAGREPARPAVRLAVQVLLDRLAVAAPGHSVEVRVPPYGAVQAVAGTRHTRGTPPNVVETGPKTWIMLATGRLGWADALDLVSASGTRADLSAYLPVVREEELR